MIGWLVGWLAKQENGEEEEEEGEESDEEEGGGGGESGDDFADMNREELSELWGVLRRLGWFSLLQDNFSTVMFANVLAYVRKRCGVCFRLYGLGLCAPICFVCICQQ